jgi:hypothetical protein
MACCDARKLRLANQVDDGRMAQKLRAQGIIGQRGIDHLVRCFRRVRSASENRGGPSTTPRPTQTAKIDRHAPRKASGADKGMAVEIIRAERHGILLERLGILEGEVRLS